MSMAPIMRENTAAYVALVRGLVIAMVGPVTLAAALVVIVIGLVLQLRLPSSLLIAGAGLTAGTWFNGFQGMLTEPIRIMADLYRDIVLPTIGHNPNAVFGYFGKMLLHTPAWTMFGPLGVVAGSGVLMAKEVFLTGPVRTTAHGQPRAEERGSWFAGLAKRRVDQAEAATPDGSLLGIDKMSGRRVLLTDADANTHTLVLGTTGSGKTVSVLNMVESAINRQLPVVYVDGKGDYDLASKVLAYARNQGRPVYLFAMNGSSCVYNPLASGGYSAKKDRIVELREWSEDHYRKLAEGYMQTVFKVLEACAIKTDLITVADYMSIARLTELMEHQGGTIADRERLLRAIKKREPAEEHVKSLQEEVWTLAESEIGHLFDTEACDPKNLLELLSAIDQRAVVFFCLPALQFPALAKLVGKLVINDLKSVAATQVAKAKDDRIPFYTIFDEFSVFAGEQVLNLINQGRSAGVHGVLATQSVADIGRAVTNGPDHFIRQVFGSCNNYLIQRLNAAEDVTAMVEMIGTEDAVEHTAQVDLLGSTGMGSARRTKAFAVHPDTIKRLTSGEAIFINKNRDLVQHILVRRSPIDR